MINTAQLSFPIHTAATKVAAGLGPDTARLSDDFAAVLGPELPEPNVVVVPTLEAGAPLIDDLGLPFILPPALCDPDLPPNLQIALPPPGAHPSQGRRQGQTQIADRNLPAFVTENLGAVVLPDQIAVTELGPNLSLPAKTEDDLQQTSSGPETTPDESVLQALTNLPLPVQAPALPSPPAMAPIEAPAPAPAPAPRAEDGRFPARSVQAPALLARSDVPASDTARGDIEATRTEATRTEATRTEATRTEATRTEATRTEATKIETGGTEMRAPTSQAEPRVNKQTSQATQPASLPPSALVRAEWSGLGFHVPATQADRPIVPASPSPRVDPLQPQAPGALAPHQTASVPAVLSDYGLPTAEAIPEHPFPTAQLVPVSLGDPLSEDQPVSQSRPSQPQPQPEQALPDPSAPALPEGAPPPARSPERPDAVAFASAATSPLPSGIALGAQPVAMPTRSPSIHAPALDVLADNAPKPAQAPPRIAEPLRQAAGPAPAIAEIEFERPLGAVSASPQASLQVEQRPAPQTAKGALPSGSMSDATGRGANQPVRIVWTRTTDMPPLPTKGDIKVHSELPRATYRVLSPAQAFSRFQTMLDQGLSLANPVPDPSAGAKAAATPTVPVLVPQPPNLAIAVVQADEAATLWDAQLERGVSQHVQPGPPLPSDQGGRAAASLIAPRAQPWSVHPVRPAVAAPTAAVAVAWQPNGASIAPLNPAAPALAAPIAIAAVRVAPEVAVPQAIPAPQRVKASTTDRPLTSVPLADGLVPPSPDKMWSAPLTASASRSAPVFAQSTDPIQPQPAPLTTAPLSVNATLAGNLSRASPLAGISPSASPRQDDGGAMGDQPDRSGPVQTAVGTQRASHLGQGAARTVAVRPVEMKGSVPQPAPAPREGVSMPFASPAQASIEPAVSVAGLAHTTGLTVEKPARRAIAANAPNRVQGPAPQSPHKDAQTDTPTSAPVPPVAVPQTRNPTGDLSAAVDPDIRKPVPALPVALSVPTVPTNAPILPAAHAAAPPAAPAEKSGHALPKRFSANLARSVVESGHSRSELIMEPAELGRLRFDIVTQGDRVQINLSAERPETLDLLRRHAEELRQEFRASGLDTGSLNFNQWGGQGQGRTQPDRAFDDTPADDTLFTPPAALSAPRQPVSVAGLDQIGRAHV